MNLLKRNLPILAIVGAIVVLAGLLFLQLARTSYGNIQQETPSPQATTQLYDFFATSTAQTDFSTTTTATSTNITTWTDSNGRIDKGYFVIAGAKNVTVFFDREGKNGNAGSGLFRIQVAASTSPTVWMNYDMLQQITTKADANANGVRVGTAAISAATSTLMYRMDALGFYAIRCIVTETTDGEHRCWALAEY